MIITFLLIIFAFYVTRASNIASNENEQNQNSKWFSSFSFFNFCCTNTINDEEILLHRKKATSKALTQRNWNTEFERYAFFLMIADYLSIPEIEKLSQCNWKMYIHLKSELIDFNQYLCDTCLMHFVCNGKVLRNDKVRQKLQLFINGIYKWNKYNNSIQQMFHDTQIILSIENKLNDPLLLHELLLIYEDSYNYPLLPKPLLHFYLAKENFRPYFSAEKKLKYIPKNHRLILYQEKVHDVRNIHLPLFFAVFINSKFTELLDPFNGFTQFHYASNSRAPIKFEYVLKNNQAVLISWSPAVHIIVHPTTGQDLHTHFSITLMVDRNGQSTQTQSYRKVGM
jgi:hypothetical protein